MKNFDSIKNTVIKEFSSKGVQDSYEEMTRNGLWNSEKLIFKKYFEKNSLILDIGCGSGRTTFALKKLGYKVLGVDLTPAMIETAKTLSKEFKINIDFQIGDITNLKFKDKIFDNSLFSFNGWNQIPGKENRIKALKELARVTKNYVIFTAHARDFKGWKIFWTKQWIKFYILKPLGFKVKALEFGDRFFRKGSKEVFENDQFIHIPSLNDIKDAIKIAGLDLEFYSRRNKISPSDSDLKSGNCIFFVCKPTTKPSS